MVSPVYFVLIKISSSFLIISISSKMPLSAIFDLGQE
jgi:hypothetical protein